MKTKRRLKGLSDIRRQSGAPYRDPTPLVRAYQQKRIDEARDKVAALPETIISTKEFRLDHTPVAAPDLPALPSVPEPYSIPIGDKRYVAAEITEEIARQMTAEAAALQGKTLTEEQTEAMVLQLVATGAFWKKHEQKQRDRIEAGKDPVKANAAGVGYSGPAMPDKGLQDGSCNRTACQMPLAGQRQFFMRDHMTGGRLHYCAACAEKFDEADAQFREPRRCTELTPENRA